MLQKWTRTTKDASGCEFCYTVFATEIAEDEYGDPVYDRLYVGKGVEAPTLKELKRKVANLPR